MVGDPSFELTMDGFEAATTHLQELSRTAVEETEQVIRRAATALAEDVEAELLKHPRWAAADIEVTYGTGEDDHQFAITVHGKDVYSLEWGGDRGADKAPALILALREAEKDASRRINTGLSNLFSADPRPNGGVRGVRAQEWHRG